MVGIGGRTPALHESNPVSLGVRERPVAANAIAVDGYIDLQPLHDRVLLAEGQSVDYALAFARPVEPVGMIGSGWKLGTFKNTYIAVVNTAPLSMCSPCW